MTTKALARLPRTAQASLLAVSLLALAGCGSSSNSSSSSASSAPAAPAQTTQAAPAESSTSTSGSSSGSSAAGGSSKLSLEANSGGQLAYNTKSLSASAGNVTIDFTNNSPVEHDVTVESSGGQKVGATPTFTGGSKTLTLSNLKPGTYKFFCSVPGHRQAGMEGTLVVK
ncbi:MAG TPA: plastocyanin/azurin family copper-binding protein [Solirubrobacteraceae bacterium]|nr:plastocyanin/azurin family copper-binding protein [Solirubrobacteraceae bacterium]